jgi:DNA-binding transcriptional ArsR family regulator
MVHNDEDRLDLVFHALADRTRRDILKRLGSAELIVSELALSYDMSLTAVSKHIKVLETAGLVRTTKTGRVHRCTMQFEPLEVVGDQIAFYKQFWERRLDGLEKHVKDAKKRTKEYINERTKID